MVVITGANGFIGSHLVQLFKNPLKCDVTSFAMVHPASLFFHIRYKKPAAIFHLGAVSSTTETDSVKITQNNILFSCELLEHCIENNIAFVYASSASVYGLGNNGFDENARMDPLNYYAISKSSFDLIVKQKIIDNPQAKIVGLRYFNVYGTNEGHKVDMASPVHKFLEQAKETNEIKIFEESEYYLRDFVHVDDVVNITKEAFNFPSGIYNVGTGNARSFLDVAQIIANATDSKITEIPFPQHLVGKYQKYTCSDNTKINSTDYNTKRISLEEGIKRVING